MTHHAVPQARHQALALGLAALLTVSVLGSLDHLATRPAQNELLAASTAASQVVVMPLRRGPRG
jgi:hypothetical protein